MNKIGQLLLIFATSSDQAKLSLFKEIWTRSKVNNKNNTNSIRVKRTAVWEWFEYILMTKGGSTGLKEYTRSL